MSLRTLISSILSASKRPTSFAPRINVAAQLVKSKGRARLNTSATVSTRNSRLNVSNTAGRTRVSGSTRAGNARINFGF